MKKFCQHRSFNHIFGTVNAVNLKTRTHYASDDTDDLLGSIITNKHKDKKKKEPKGPVDEIV